MNFFIFLVNLLKFCLPCLEYKLFFVNIPKRNIYINTFTLKRVGKKCFFLFPNMSILHINGLRKFSLPFAELSCITLINVKIFELCTKLQKKP